MGTISEKLEYLNTTKTKIRESINLTGAGLTTNDTFRSYAVKLKDTLMEGLTNPEEFIETIVENSPKDEAIGTTLSFNAYSLWNDTQLLGNTTQASSPTPSTPQEVKTVTGNQVIDVVGKNLFNKDIGFVNGYINSSGTFVSNNTIVLFNDYITVEGNNYYTFSANNKLTNLTIVAYDSTKTFISRQIMNNKSVNTWSLPQNCKYVRLQFNYNDTANIINQALIDSLNLQFEKGNTQTTYEPYKGNTYPIQLGDIELCKIGNYQDKIYKSGDTWYLHKEIGKYIFNGSESWYKAVTGTNTNLYYTQLTYISADVLSQYFTRNDNLYTEDVEGMRGVINNNRMWFRINNTTVSDANAFKTWLSTHNTDVYYVLATSTDTEITNEELINELDDFSLITGLNQITISSEYLPAILKIKYLVKE